MIDMNRLRRLEEAVNAAVGDEPTSMVDDRRFFAALSGALPEEEIEAFAARWAPEFARLFSPSDRHANHVESQIRAVEDSGDPT